MNKSNLSQGSLDWSKCNLVAKLSRNDLVVLTGAWLIQHSQERTLTGSVRLLSFSKNCTTQYANCKENTTQLELLSSLSMGRGERKQQAHVRQKHFHSPWLDAMSDLLKCVTGNVQQLTERISPSD